MNNFGVALPQIIYHKTKNRPKLLKSPFFSGFEPSSVLALYKKWKSRPPNWTGFMVIVFITDLIRENKNHKKEEPQLRKLRVEALDWRAEEDSNSRPSGP